MYIFCEITIKMASATKVGDKTFYIHIHFWYLSLNNDVSRLKIKALEID